MNNFNDIINQKLKAFPIGVWVPYYQNELSPEYLADMKNCGINFLPSNTCEKQELDMIENAGLSVIVNDDRVVYSNITGILQLKEYAKDYVDRKNTLGLFIWDEPSPLMMNFCGTINRELQRVYPQTFGYINLHPNYSDQEIQRNGKTYEEYLEYFVQKAQPKVLSYDNYPFYEDGFHGENYFENMAAVLSCAKRHGLDFWSFMQSSSFSKNVVPTLGQLAFQVHSTIAYGAKGILYFTYREVTHEDNFGGGFIDRNGNKTHIYDYAKQINQKVSSYGNTLLKLKHKGVKFFGKYEQFTTVEPKFTLSGEFLVGLFDLDGKEYAYVVNLDMENSKVAEIKLENNDIKKVTLPAGGGELIEI